jgi:hypothetical protein
MNNELGSPAEAGMACRYIHESPLCDVFGNETLQAALREMQYVGLVSVSMVLDGRVTGIQTGAPCWGLYNLLEGIRGRTVEFLTGETTGLMESWTVGLLMSRFPWPFEARHSQVKIGGMTPAIEKHFWSLETSGYKRAFVSTGPLVGVATAWSPTLSEANRRALRTLEAIELPGKQYRTDVVSSVGERVRELTDRGWLV